MKKFFLIFCLFFFSYFHIAFALEITEVMYDTEGTDTDREWIEIYNNDGVAVDVSTYKLFEANTNHGLTLVQGEKNLPAGSYAIIVQNKDKFKNDWPNFTGPIFDSSFSLSNDGEIFSIKDSNLNIISELNYLSSMGANGDGKSLQKINNIWQSAIPTLGLTNTNSTLNENNSTSDQNNNSNQNTNSINSSSGSITTNTKELKNTTKIIMNSFGFAKNPLEIKVETRNTDGEKIFYGKYFFNFSDGSSAEYNASSFDKISYVYKYAGEYFVHLSYYMNPYDTVPTATDKFLVKILDAGVFISSTGGEEDFFIEIKNNTNYESDISLWYIASGNKKFVFPKNSFLPANIKIILAPEITGFAFEDKENLRLYNSTGNLIFDYSVFSKIKNQNSQILVKKIPEKTKIQNNIPENSKNVDIFDLSSVDNENLQANSINTLPLDNKKENFWIYFLTMIFLIIFAIFLVLFLRKKEEKTDPSDDFEIL